VPVFFGFMDKSQSEQFAEYLQTLDTKTQQTQSSILNRYFENKTAFLEKLDGLSSSTKKNYLAVISAFENYATNHVEASSFTEMELIEIQKKELAKAELAAKKHLAEAAQRRLEQQKLQAQLELLAEADFEAQEIPKIYSEFDPKAFIPSSTWASRQMLGTNYDEFENLARIERNIILAGPAGTGKSETCLKFCAKNKIPLFKFSCTHDTQTSDIFSQPTIEIDNEKQVVKQIAGMAMKAILSANKHGMAMLQLEEANSMSAQVQKIFNSIMDDTRFVDLPSGRVELAKGAKIWTICTINESYSGTNPLNKDFLDRCTVQTFQKLNQSETAKYISEKFGLDMTEIQKIHKFQSKFEYLVEINEIADTVEFGMRAIQKIANLVKSGIDTQKAIEYSVVNKILDKNDRASVYEKLCEAFQ
jgi:MoxR-like ATPase